jgi:hypothetical protein
LQENAFDRRSLGSLSSHRSCPGSYHNRSARLLQILSRLAP